MLGISRSSLYYLPTEAGAEDLELMALIDQQYLKTPFYGSRRMTAWLSNHGHQVNRKRVRRLMQLIGLEAIYRRPNTSKPVKPSGDRVCNRTSLPCGLCRYCSMAVRRGIMRRRDTLCLSRSFADGGLAEYVVYPEGSVIPVPDGVDMVDAAVSACAIATPYHALSEVAQVRPEEIVLVTGAGGGLGIHTIQLVHLFGARAIGWTRSESKRAALESVGVDELICGTGDATPVWQQLLDLTMGWGVDVVIDYVGSAAFSDAFRGMAPLGRYVILGEMLGEEIHINPAFIFFKRAKILGSGPHMRSDVYRVLEFVRRGKIKPIIGGVYSLEQISEVHALLDEGAITGRAVVAL